MLIRLAGGENFIGALVRTRRLHYFSADGSKYLNYDLVVRWNEIKNYTFDIKFDRIKH